jgi:deazaflavin-dependent oxidoreductase (nitroreductase family)
MDIAAACHTGRVSTGPTCAPLPSALRAALREGFAVRTLHTGRRTGAPRMVETTFAWDGADHLVLSGYPGARDWVANLAANPRASVLVPTEQAVYAIPVRARVLRARRERVPHLLRFVGRWARRMGAQGWILLAAVGLLRAHHALRLPWWGPYAIAARLLERMPCVELTFTGAPRAVDARAQDASEPVSVRVDTPRPIP